MKLPIKIGIGRVFIAIVSILLLAAALFITGIVYRSVKTIGDLLTENKKLKQALATLAYEDQIGYAKVIKQETRGGQLYTTLRFVETARDNKLNKVLERDYAIEGDIIYFDALIVSFSPDQVIDGKERSLYLWRRVYGDNTAPSQGYPIEEEGQAPKRYEKLMDRLHVKEQKIFWDEIWKLSNSPDALSQYGIRAVYGTVVYKKLQANLIYIFKISSTGQLYPETIPDF